MIIEYLKDGKKMLTNKISFTTNVSSNIMAFSSNSSIVPNTLFELMRTNILIVDSSNMPQQILGETIKIKNDKNSF